MALPNLDPINPTQPALIRCTQCGGEVGSEDRFCIDCGAEIRKEK